MRSPQDLKGKTFAHTGRVEGALTRVMDSYRRPREHTWIACESLGVSPKFSELRSMSGGPPDTTHGPRVLPDRSGTHGGQVRLKRENGV